MPIRITASPHRLSQIHVPHRVHDFRDISSRILHLATRGILRIDFLREVSAILLTSSKCDCVAMRLREHDNCYRTELHRRHEPPFHYEVISGRQKTGSPPDAMRQHDPQLERWRSALMGDRRSSALPPLTERGSLWTGNVSKLLKDWPSGRKGNSGSVLPAERGFQSLAMIPIMDDRRKVGLIEMRSARQNFFSKDQIEFYEGIAQMLGVSLVHRITQVKLRERVKELTCLYGISQWVERPGASQDEILQGIVDLLPPAWLYPEIASARIILDGRTFTSTHFQEGCHQQKAEIIANGDHRGIVEMTYSESRPEIDEGPFLKEERSLIDAVAKEVVLLVERLQAEEERSKLQEQLRHADRLATIGQLSAGVAHELNEPLGSILGFAQLAIKSTELPRQTTQDLEKIVAATLHAREVVKKLMLFSRQLPPRTDKVDLNQMVEEGLYFLEARCIKAGIELVRDLHPDLPKVNADPSQLHQVLVNLVVNALQAMPEGGRLIIRTLACNSHVSLVVEDTGLGMSKEVMQQIFIPFFTTKDIGEGTGLGLPVVHGIVTAHGGSIKVESEVGRGSRFEILLPVSYGFHEKGVESDGIFE
jgi:two-component system NtrC family sensor kinase